MDGDCRPTMSSESLFEPGPCILFCDPVVTPPSCSAAYIVSEVVDTPSFGRLFHPTTRVQWLVIAALGLLIASNGHWLELDNHCQIGMLEFDYVIEAVCSLSVIVRRVVR